MRDEKRGVLILLHKDFWDIPGGRIDDDENFEQTLRRELAEELPGCEVKEVRELKGAFRVEHDIEEDTGLVLLYYLAEVVLPDEIAISDEHDDYKFLQTSADIPESMNPVVQQIIKDVLAG